MRYLIILFIIIVSTKTYADHKSGLIKGLFKCELEVPQEGIVLKTEELKGLEYKK